MDDRDLINLFLKGDTSVFNTLVRRHQKPLFNYILKLVGNRDDAADLSQRVFIRCFKSLKKLKEKDKFNSWLYSIAVNQVRDHWRKRKEILSLDDEGEGVSPAENLTDSSPEPDKLAESESRAELVRKALHMLPPEQKEVLVLKIYQDLKFTEIAEIIGAPLNTVKSRLYYGLSAMRKIFKKWNLEELAHHEV